ncbi:FecR domain-containing protein [Sorangium sp. So ce1182]|uniref:FecR domain-containing protein n=1 Tax=Sorangium sp. So ce1182 TaxID=3133334 RepID=UPI003F62AB4C
MGRSERSLTALGRRVAELQDRAPGARLDLERGRARLLEAELPGGRWGGGSGGAAGARSPSGARLRAPGRGGRGRVAAWMAAAAALVLSTVALVIVARRGAPMRFELGATEVGIVGAWIAAPAAAELPIRFSDGSLLRLAPGGRARVASVDANGAEIALERGALDVAVVHREGARWRVRVGPFLVNVIGTRFETRWDPVSERFEVALRDGAITVTGPLVGDARAIRAGERLVVSPGTNMLEVAPIPIDATTLGAGSTSVGPGSTPAGSEPGSTPVGSTSAATTLGADSTSVGPGSTSVGSTSVGPGSTPVGSTSVGPGSTSVGSTSVGPGSTSVGSTSVGPGSTPVGSTSVGPGSTPVGSTSVGSTSVGSTSVGPGSTPVGSTSAATTLGSGSTSVGSTHLPGHADAEASLAPLPAAPETPRWRALALDARYKDALAAAEREGFDALCATASAGDLHALGDAARLGGSTARAVQAFTALRRRFPGSPEAASAAFLLGRIAQDQSNDPAGSARWFTRYLTEHPGGAFAADAAGRLVEAEDRRGDDAGARRAAERYLAAYPNGSHAAYARRLLARAPSPTPAPSSAAPAEPPAP